MSKVIINCKNFSKNMNKNLILCQNLVQTYYILSQVSYLNHKMLMKSKDKDCNFNVCISSNAKMSMKIKNMTEKSTQMKYLRFWSLFLTN